MSEILAWFVDNGKAPFATVRKDVARAWSEAGMPVTPLVAAPPEGAPTYAELAEFIWNLPDLGWWAVECLNSGRTQSHDDLSALAKRQSALLSRIPKDTV